MATSRPPTLLELFEQAEPTPLVSGSLASLAGFKPGDEVLLDLSGYELLGRSFQDVKPPRCVVGGRVGALYVDTRDKSGWTEQQIWAWRHLDELIEVLDHAADDPTNYVGQLAERSAKGRKRQAELDEKRQKNTLYAAKRQVAS